MNGLILGLYGVFILAVGIQGKSEQLLNEVGEDMPGFIPWALSIVVLIILAQTEQTEKLVKPFIGLLILNFVLVNFGNLKAEIQKIQSLSQGGE